MEYLNYHHLRYFREVAHEGNLTRASERLNLSQSAVSTQIRLLEEQLGHALFRREGRKLILTEVGRIALDHADRIFGTGHELLQTLKRASTAIAPLRVGAVSTLSRNFQMQFLRPALEEGALDLVLSSGNAERLYADLAALALDVVLTTEPPHHGERSGFVAHRIAEDQVWLHGRPEMLDRTDLTTLMNNAPFILPSETPIRSGFDGLAAQLGVKPRIVADVDDMAMVRLLAREGAGIAVAPTVVLRDEIASGRVVTAPHDLGIRQSFYAVTVQRSFPHPSLETLLERSQPAVAR